MTALIIDTSGSHGFLALSAEGKIVQTIALPSGRELSKLLFSSILSFGNIKIEFVAVGTGPGTFTGTRVGATVAQALAFGWNVPLVEFASTLLPDLSAIGHSTYQSFLLGHTTSQIELVYISPTS
jgi:tRNA threonylcarbamoyladenosine biosynthesis protein TsaB